MSKRFTDTDLWKKQRWFRKLNPNHKLAFGYIKDQCNHAGIWKIDCSDLIEDLGILEFNLPDFVSEVNTEYEKITGIKESKNRLIFINKKTIWITGFIQFQWEGKDCTVNWHQKAVKSALFLLDSVNCSEPFRTIPNHSEPLPYHCRPLSLLHEALCLNYIKLTIPLANGWQPLGKGIGEVYLKEEGAGEENFKNRKNGKESIINFEAQGSDLLARRTAAREREVAERSRKENNQESA